MLSRGNLFHPSRCYTSVRTNAISALFAKKRGGGEIPPWVGLSTPRQAASLGWAGHVTKLGWGLTTSHRGLGLIAALLQQGRARGGRRTEEVPRRHHRANAVCVAPSVLSEERPLISEQETQADGRAGTRFPLLKRSYI